MFRRVDKSMHKCNQKECSEHTYELQSLEDEYTHLEETYFDLESQKDTKLSQLNDILVEKESEKAELKKFESIYKNHEISHLDLGKLRQFEDKILKSLELIKSQKKRGKSFTIYLVLCNAKRQLNKNTKTCVICYELDIDIYFKPCNHMCVCQECSKKIQNCPMCRDTIVLKEQIRY